MADLETVASDLGWRFEIATKGGENSLSQATASRSPIVQAFRLWNVDRSDTRLSFVCSLHHFRQSTQREITDFLYITRTASDRRMINRYTRKL